MRRRYSASAAASTALNCCGFVPRRSTESSESTAAGARARFELRRRSALRVCSDDRGAFDCQGQRCFFGVLLPRRARAGSMSYSPSESGSIGGEGAPLPRRGAEDALPIVTCE